MSGVPHVHQKKGLEMIFFLGGFIHTTDISHSISH
jgi:hypothetical protein